MGERKRSGWDVSEGGSKEKDNDGCAIRAQTSSLTSTPAKEEVKSNVTTDDRNEPSRKRRFQDDAPPPSKSNDRKTRISRWSDSPTVDDPPKDAAELQREILAYLKEDRDNCDKRDRDTYEDALESGGVIEGGTWEHRKRAKEMISTANLSQALNQMHTSRPGKSLHSYITKEILDAFNSKCAAVKAGVPGAENIDIFESQGKALGSENKGFQLLKKAGWSEGSGLGSHSQGITTPVVAKVQQVIGEKSTVEPDKNDDEFEQYRKRMMVAYRFRPNPLNNPRRSYDGYKTVFDPSVINSVVNNVTKRANEKN